MKVALAVVTLCVLAGCSSSGHAGASGSASSPSAAASTASAATFDISGTLSLYGEISTGADSMKLGAQCIGITNPDFPSEDYEDIAEGADITVTDGDHETVGVGSLGPGTLENVNPIDQRVCSFSYSVTGITAGKGFYTMSIGDQQTKTYPEAQFRDVTDIGLKSALYDG